MTSLTVYFVGLCTHLTKSSSGVVTHRVVLPNAGRDRLVNGRLVRKHDARMRVRGRPDLDRTLAGVTITVNSTTSKVTYDPSYETCIPRLRDFAESGVPPLSATMIAGENADLVSAYFDASGTFAAGVNKEGAAIAYLHVDTIGSPVLTLDLFEGQTERLELPLGAIVSIENVDAGEGRRVDHDFLLHFKLFVNVPPDAEWPRHTTGCTELQDPELSAPAITVGPGCSNSTYP